MQQYTVTSPKLIQFFGYNPFPVDDSTFGGRIKKYRIEHDISHKKLARLVEVDESTIRMWERNERTPFPKKMRLLEQAMNQKEPST